MFIVINSYVGQSVSPYGFFGHPAPYAVYYSNSLLKYLYIYIRMGQINCVVVVVVVVVVCIKHNLKSSALTYKYLNPRKCQ